MLAQIRLLVLVFFSLAVLSGAFRPWEDSQEEASTLAIGKVKAQPEEDGPGVYSSYQVEVPPRILNYEEVREYIGYPEIAKNAGIQGNVVLKVLVDESGNYVKHEVVEDFHPLLRMPCEALVPYLQFDPAVHKQQKVMCWMSIPFDFDLPAYGK